LNRHERTLLEPALYQCAIGAKARFGTHLRVLSAGTGPDVIDRAISADGVKVLAIAAGSARQRENAVLEVEVLNESSLAQALGNLLGLFVFGFKGINQFELNQIGHFHFYWHGAAVGSARVAQTRFVSGPSVGAVHVNNAEG